MMVNSREQGDNASRVTSVLTVETERRAIFQVLSREEQGSEGCA